jgi:hypothetical protein
MDELNEGEQQEAEVKNGSQAERTTKPTSKKKLESSQPRIKNIRKRHKDLKPKKSKKMNQKTPQER